MVASFQVREVPVRHGFGRFGEEGHQQRERAGGLQAGKLVIAGSAETAGETQAAVARLWSSFIFADGFERGSTRTWLSTAP